MEALRKAEEAKRRMQQEEQAASSKDSRVTPGVQPSGSGSAGSAFSLEEREPDVTPDYILDNFTQPQDQATTPEPVSEPPLPEAAPEPDYAREPTAERDTGARTLARRQQRAAAASVFVAKQNPGRNRKTLTILVIVMVLMIPVGGGVLWYLQSASAPSMGVNPTIAAYDLSSRGFIGETPAPAAGAPEAAVVGTVAATATDVQATVTEEETVATAEIAPAETATATATPDEIATTPAAEEPIPDSAVAVVSPPQALVEAPDSTTDAAAGSSITLPETSATGVLEVSRSGGTRQINPQLVSAYDRLQAGDLLVAGQLYQEVLMELPNNRDALLGLALVSLRQGELVAARERYARVLQLNPRDPLGHTGLLQTMQVTDPIEHESALKMLIGDYPDVAQLSLALGNLYASQQRWSEAQVAYYNALLTASRTSGGSVHPDYAFNLAISLEQLNQKKAALDYYRQARTLALAVTPGFDPQLLNSRIATLEQDQP